MPDPISNRAVALNQVQINSAPITAPEVSQTGLSTLLSGEGGTIEFSDSGANGAILVKMPGSSSGGAAIKLEGSIVGQRVEKVSSLMEDFFSNAKGPAPFVAPRVTKISSKNLDQNPEALGKISELLEQQRNNENAFRIDKFSKRLNEVPEGESDVMVMELAQGRQISRLSTDDKLALYKSDQFARSLGTSMPVMMSLRLVDHLGSGDPMCFKNNVSNLMFDVGTGQMSVIDFDTGFQQSRVDEKLHRIGPPPGGFNPAGMVGDLNQFVTESCSSPEKFQEAVDKLVRGEDTPLKNLMGTFTDDRDQEQTLFNRLESEQVKGTLTLEDKRRFAANLLIGVVDGMDYMQKNEEALRTAVTNSHEMVETVNGVAKVEHFYNEKELNDYCEQVRNLDTNGLKQKVRDLAMGAPQVRLDSLSRDMEDRNRRVAEIQERLNHLDGKLIKTGGVRDEIQNLQEERVRLSKELEGCKQELNDIINREEITKMMTSQKPMLPGEELDLPRVPSVRESLKSESSNRLSQEIGEKLNVVEELPGEKLEENPRVEDLDKVDEGVKLPIENENQPPTVTKTLTEQEQQKLQNLTAQIGQIEQGLEAVKSMPRKVAALSKLDTRGKAPDFSTFSDQELRDIFDLASKANDLNKIDSVDHNHKFSTLKVYEDKLTSENLSREELEEFVTTILAVQNNHIPPGDLVTAQTLLMGSADRGFSGWVDNVRFDYNELRKQVEERNGPNSLDDGGLGNRINTVRPEVKKIAGEHSEMANAYGRQAPRVTLEALGQQGATAREVADKIEEMTVRMGGKEKTDLRGIDLTGVDLSESDLSEAIMDVPTLARAGGLDTVRGVDPEILKNAKDFARLTTEQERLKDKLSALQKPWSFERFKAFFKPGGAEGAIRNLKNRIEQTTFDLINADPGRKERMQKLDEARSLQELGNTLKSPALSEAFSKFATSESNGANVSFLRELEDLKEELSSGVELGDLKVHVFGIQQRYLATPAETPVQLDDETRDMINQTIDGDFDELDKEKIGKLFNKAEEEISSSLALGTLQRFKQTEEFRNLNELDGQKPLKVGEGAGIKQPLKVSQSKVGPRVH